MALIYCPDCGNQTSDQALECIKCGYPITKLNSSQSQNVSSTNSQKRKDSLNVEKSNLGNTIALILLLVLLLSAGYYFYHINTAEYIEKEKREALGIF
jgi:uncharacterized membrane protein YvbJ